LGRVVRENLALFSSLTCVRITDEVYLACDILSGSSVVIKLERIEGKNHSLHHEFRIYTKLEGKLGVPRVHWFGTEAGFDAMVIDRLGQSLDDLFVSCDFRFTIKTVLLLAEQLVRHSEL
jgi:predicted Ser/Thr protein kinase